MSEWAGDVRWWFDEVAEDAIFDSDVLPLATSLLAGASGTWLDLGCGEGRVMRAIAGQTIGCDLSLPLLRACPRGVVVRSRLPDLRWARDGAFAGAYAVLVLEHLADLASVLQSVHRVVRPGGRLAVVANHPAFTARGSGPVVDVDDGEVLWRWGPYFDAGPAPVRFAGGEVTFHHRSLGEILTTAAEAGWSLERMDERPLSAAAVAAAPGYVGQERLPRLIGLYWARR